MFDAFRITQAPSYSGTSNPTGTSGVLHQKQMAEHLSKFAPVWREVAAGQSWPLDIIILGRIGEQWHMATTLSPRSLRPTLDHLPTLTMLGLGEVEQKSLYISGYDRTGVFRFSIPSGSQLPAGIIAGKGWTLKTEYRTNLKCSVCGDYLADQNNNCLCNEEV